MRHCENQSRIGEMDSGYCGFTNNINQRISVEIIRNALTATLLKPAGLRLSGFFIV
jgi:hypothetical protein